MKERRCDDILETGRSTVREEEGDENYINLFNGKIKL